MMLNNYIKIFMVIRMYVDYKEVGKRIAKRRKELGLKQSQVTEKAGLSDKYLSNIERATSILSIDVLMKLCAVLQITPDELLLGSTANVVDSDYQKYVCNKLSTMNEKQLNIVINFLEWISSQNL